MTDVMGKGCDIIRGKGGKEVPAAFLVVILNQVECLMCMCGSRMLACYMRKVMAPSMRRACTCARGMQEQALAHTKRTTSMLACTYLLLHLAVTDISIHKKTSLA